jgi:Valyl-tRNA synthetase
MSTADVYVRQLKKLGSSADWDRERFTMDNGCSECCTGSIYPSVRKMLYIIREAASSTGVLFVRIYFRCRG